MTPSQLLQQIPLPEAAYAAPEENTIQSTDIDFTPCAAGAHYTSDAMEEDFSTSVELLMESPKFLRFLLDADQHFSILGAKARQQLIEHIDTVEEFTGQWLNIE
jgi:hypothetical protein